MHVLQKVLFVICVENDTGTRELSTLRSFQYRSFSPLKYYKLYYIENKFQIVSTSTHLSKNGQFLRYLALEKVEYSILGNQA